MNMQMIMASVFGAFLSMIPITEPNPFVTKTSSELVVSNMGGPFIPLSEPEVSETEVDCLARNIYHEARGESLVGQIAVGQVTLNRMNLDLFPNSICDVVYQASRSGCQFSWTCDLRSDEIRDETEWQQIRDVSRKILEGYYPDITEGSTFYHADYVSPNWARRMAFVATIGSHVFYRLPDELMEST